MFRMLVCSASQLRRYRCAAFLPCWDISISRFSFSKFMLRAPRFVLDTKRLGPTNSRCTWWCRCVSLATRCSHVLGTGELRAGRNHHIPYFSASSCDNPENDDDYPRQHMPHCPVFGRDLTRHSDDNKFLNCDQSLFVFPKTGYGVYGTSVSVGHCDHSFPKERSLVLIVTYWGSRRNSHDESSQDRVPISWRRLFLFILSSWPFKWNCHFTKKSISN